MYKCYQFYKNVLMSFSYFASFSINEFRFVPLIFKAYYKGNFNSFS